MVFATSNKILLSNKKKIISNVIDAESFSKISYPIINLSPEKGELNLSNNTTLLNLSKSIVLEKDTLVYSSRGKHQIFNCPPTIYGYPNFAVACVIALEFITASRNIFLSSNQWRMEFWAVGTNINFRCSLQDDLLTSTAPPTIYSKLLDVNKYYLFFYTYDSFLKKAFLYVNDELQGTTISEYIPLSGGVIYFPFPSQWIKVAYLKYWNESLNQSQVSTLTKNIKNNFKILLEN